MFAQNIIGTVIDSQSQPVEFANVALYSLPDSTLKTGVVTNKNGEFEIEEKRGDYFVEILFIGKSLFIRNITLDRKIDLGVIKVDNSTTMQEIVIIKEKKLLEKKSDRLVFNVENLTIATEGDVLDILKITPRIKVQNDQISVIGKSGISVMINDRMTFLSGSDLVNFLRTLTSDEIKSIEVITNPPAKYNAEGNSGIINIITKKQRQDEWNATMRSIYQQATYPTGLGGVGFNFKKNKITLSSNLNYSKGSNAPVENYEINYTNLYWKEHHKRRDFNENTSGRLGLDYKISDKISTGIIYNYVSSTPDVRDNIKSSLSNYDTNLIDSLVVTLGNSSRDGKTNRFNYHFIYVLDTLNRKLSFDFDFFNYNLSSNHVFQTKTYDNNSTEISDSFNSANNRGLQDINNCSLNLDLEHPFEWANLNYGGRLSFIKTDNDFESYDLTTGTPIFISSQSNRFKYKENTTAVYFSAQKEINEKWEAQIGMRLENTQIAGNSIAINKKNKTRYTKLFPTAYILFVPTDNHSFSLSYNKRIIRPNYNLLNPFKWINSPYSYSEGNPHLQPSFANNIEFEYVFKENYISSFYFSYTDDEFEQVSIIDDETNIQQVKPLNFLVNKTLGFNQTIILKPLEWLNINFFGDVYYSSTDSKIPITLNYLKGWNGEFALNSDFIFNQNKTMMANIGYGLVTKGVDNLDYNTAFNYLNASFKALFLDKKLIVSMSVNDMFSSRRVTYTTYSNGIRNTVRNYYDERFLRIGVTYNFGKSFDLKSRENKNKTEIDRTN